MAYPHQLALPAPTSTTSSLDMEYEILQLRTKLAFANDRNFALQEHLNFHV